MTWHILGAGSLGCLWAARLHQAGQPVCLVLRPARLAQFRAAGNRLLFTGLQQQQQITLPAETARADTPIQRLLLACKAYSAVEAIAGIRQRLLPDSQVILLQNGIGSQQAVHELLPDQQILVASTTEGAWSSAPFQCTHAGQGQTLLGRLRGSAGAPAWLEQLNRTGTPCQWHPDIGSVLWRKLAINCLINPATVIHDCQNGGLLQHLPLLAELSGELEQLLCAAGHAAIASDLFAVARQVISDTAANTSSMLQDVRHGRRTEISYMTGFALRQSRALGTPHRQLLALHHALQDRLAQLGLPTD